MERLVGKLRNTGVKLQNSLLNFRRAEEGVVAIIFALSLIPMVLAGGIIVDLGRAYIVKSRLNYAIDAAGLAVGSSTGTTAELEAIMVSYFDANYPDDKIGVPATPQITIDAETDAITISATVDLQTLVMHLVGYDKITVAADASFAKETTGIELSLVLDNTGSMSSEMDSLKAASNSLLDILFGEEEELDTLFVSVVPFAATVNIGQDNEGFLTGLDTDDYSPGAWNACVEARADGFDQTDDDPDTGGLWEPFLAPDTSFFGGNNWSGFFGAIGGDRDNDPGPNANCPVAILPLTNVKATIEDKIDEMEADGFTHVNFGAVWGWRTLSPTEPFSEGTEYSDESFQKVVVIMTDGENTAGGTTSSAYGGTVNSATLDERLLTVCENMRDEGIIVYTITFNIDDDDVRELMLECTGDDATRYFDSPDADDLEEAFEAIGTALSNLRITN